MKAHPPPPPPLLSPLRPLTLLPGSFLCTDVGGQYLNPVHRSSPAHGEQPGSSLGFTPGFLRDPAESLSLPEPEFPYLSSEYTSNVTVRVNGGDEDRLKSMGPCAKRNEELRCIPGGETSAQQSVRA